ncbi:MSCRAMM family protein [Paludibaculum fermentans]|uniref:MSCRAMM family protein n=1 Tax=Paludibaculum fermentans TaxID=1473598 RepID=UPI003EB73D2F
MRTRAASLLFSLFSFWCFLPSVLPAQATGSLTCLITHAHTGEPVSGVQVLLRPAGPGQNTELHATSDANGRLQFEDVKPGRYELSSTKPGFVPHRQLVEVATGVARCADRLTPFTRVSGRVTLSPDRPAAGVPVEIRRRGGRPRYTTITVADGSYVLDKLPPGRYLLSAGGRGAALRKLSGYTPVEDAPLEGSPTTWAPAFFPEGRSPAEAQVLTITGGTDLNGYDLRLRQVPVYRLRGMVVDDRGEPAVGASLELFTADHWFGAEYETTARADGSFELEGVRAGDWNLRASLARAGATLKGSLQLAVSKADLPALRLELAPPFPMEGIVERDTPRDKDGNRLVSGVYMSSEDGGADIALSFHKQDGSLHWDSIYPGRYRIRPVGFLSGWYLDSVYVGDQEVLTRAVELRPGSPPIRIVYQPRPGQVRGTAGRLGAAHVYLIPVEESLWDEQFVRYARTDPEGRFEIGSLRPGEYVAFAFDEPQDTDEFTDPALVRPLLTRGTRLSVRRGTLSEIELKPLPGSLW